MVEVRLRRLAKRDLFDIGQYTRGAWSDVQAELYIDKLLDAIEHIGDHPLLGHDMGDLREGYRRRRSGHHLIFYAVMPDGAVEIARILHEKSDVLRHLDDT